MLNITGIYVYFAKSLHFATKKTQKKDESSTRPFVFSLFRSNHSLQCYSSTGSSLACLIS